MSMIDSFFFSTIKIGMLGIEHVLCIDGRAFEQRTSRSQKSRTQILPMGAFHSALSSISVLFATLVLACTLEQIRYKHIECRTGGPVVSEFRKVPRSWQDNDVHGQVDWPVFVHKTQTQDGHNEEMRLRHTTVVLHWFVVLLWWHIE